MVMAAQEKQYYTINRFMYRYLLVGLCTLIIPISSAEGPTEAPTTAFKTQLEVVCLETDTLTKLLRDEFKEFPQFIGNTKDDTKTVLTINPKTKSWTFFVYNKGLSCVLGTGVGFNLIVQSRS